MPDTTEADLFQVQSSGRESTVECSGSRPTPLEGEIIWDDQLFSDENPNGNTIDGPTLLFRVAPDYHSPNSSHYRDEDGESRPVRIDRSSLADAMLEDLAAEFLHAKADAEAAPDPLERNVISALCDTYGRELWHRAQRGAQHVHVGGRDYQVVPRSDGFAELIIRW